MGEIEIPPGDTVKIVSQPERDAEYNAAVSGASVYLSHNAQGTRREGKRVRPGDRIALNNLRGKPVYAANPAGNNSTALVEIDRAGFNLIFQPRAVQASVQASETNEAAPRTDAFESRSGDNVDVSAGNVTETFPAPPRADFTCILVDTGGSSVTAAVEYGPAGGPYIGPTFSGSGQGAVAERVAVFGEEVNVTLSGAATDVDYRVYGR